MKKPILTLAFISLFFFSCSNDEGDDLSQQNTNNFQVNSEFYKINNAYFFPDSSTEQLDDFYVVLTDGEITSPPTNNTNIEFNNSSTNSILFRATQDPNTPTIINFVPSGSYVFNSNNETFSTAHFKFNCTPINTSLNDCQFTMLIDASKNPDVAVINIEHDNLAPINYIINFNIELEGNSVNGQFKGILNRL